MWPGGPAEAAGLKVGDILLSVDGQPAENLPTVIYNFRLRDSADPVQLEVMSGGKQKTLSVTPVEVRSDFDSVSAMADPEKNLVSELGILGVEIDQRIAATAAGLRDPYGIIVVARAAGAVQRRAAAAEGHHSSSEQPAALDSAEPQGRAAAHHAGLAGDIADSAGGETDVSVLYTRALICGSR